MTSNYHYIESVRRGRQEHGDKGSTASLNAAPQFAEYLGTGQRIKVTRTYESGEAETRFGTVGRTTGWRPSFLLMHRRNAIGSSDVLGPDDKIVAVQRRAGGPYVPVTPAGG